MRNSPLVFLRSNDGPVLLVASGPFRSGAAATEMGLAEDRKHTEVLACTAADALRPTER